MLIEDDNLNTNIRTIVSDELHEKVSFQALHGKVICQDTGKTF